MDTVLEGHLLYARLCWQFLLQAIQLIDPCSTLVLMSCLHYILPPSIVFITFHDFSLQHSSAIRKDMSSETLDITTTESKVMESDKDYKKEQYIMQTRHQN